MNQFPPWTPEMDKQLRDLADHGWSGGEIAKLMGKTRSSVCGRAIRTGVKLLGVSRYNPSSDRPVSRRTRAPRKPKPSHSEEPKPMVEPDPLPLGEAHVRSILDLRSSHCRWVYGDPRDSEFGWCGRQRDGEKRSYCPEHSKIAYRKDAA